MRGTIKLNQSHEDVDVTKLQTHPENPRRGDLEAIKSSIKTNGFYGALVANRETGYILAGNHRYLAACELGYKHVPVIWISVSEAEGRRILAADNRTSDLGDYDTYALSNLLNELRSDGMLEGTGYTDSALDELIDSLGEIADEFEDDAYTRKIESPIYEPKGERPKLKELFDDTRTQELLSKIQADTTLDDAQRRFLTLAAHRHTVFRYDKIAEYYAHAGAALQGHIEDSAMVIIDFNKAIELGFVKLKDEVAEIYKHDTGT